MDDSNKANKGNVKMTTLYCKHCKAELIEDDTLDQEIYPNLGEAHEFKLWHCPNCGTEYSGEVWYEISVKKSTIVEDFA